MNYNENIRFQQKNVVNSNEYYTLPASFESCSVSKNSTASEKGFEQGPRYDFEFGLLFQCEQTSILKVISYGPWLSLHQGVKILKIMRFQIVHQLNI